MPIKTFTNCEAQKTKKIIIDDIKQRHQSQAITPQSVPLDANRGPKTSITCIDK